MNDGELDLVESERLWAALSRRHDGILYVWTRQGNNGEDATQIGWSGGWIRALGLAQFAVARLQHGQKVEEDPGDE